MRAKFKMIHFYRLREKALSVRVASWYVLLNWIKYDFILLTYLVPQM